MFDAFFFYACTHGVARTYTCMYTGDAILAVALGSLRHCCASAVRLQRLQRRSTSVDLREWQHHEV